MRVKNGNLRKFCGCHPAVPLTWFVLVGALTMFFMHPILLVVTFLAAWCMLRRLGHSKILRIILPIMGMTALINPLFSHEGVTILLYLPSGNPVTLESIGYGLTAGLMIGTAAALCMCFTVVITTDKLLWAIGRVLPSAAMLLSMILRFIPRFVHHIKISYQSRCALLGNPTKKLERMKAAASVTSMTVTWALENSVDTADSMKGRGWGIPGRTSYSNFRMQERDWKILLKLGILMAFLLLEFSLPMMMGNGQTLGKKIFGVALMSTEGIRINSIALFIRSILGKYTIETMIPVFLIMMISYGSIGLIGTIALGTLLLVQIVLAAATKNNSLIHDLLAATVAVDMQSQMIFATRENMIAYKEKKHAEMAAKKEYP
jgi:energy-coupling factor transport system permease protein